MKQFGAVVGLCLLALLVGVPAQAQTVQGEIVGTIRDAQGGVVPDASVHIVNEGTGAVRELTSDERGDYHGVGFFQGNYRVEVEKAGFQKTSVENVTVSPVTVKRVDVALQVAQAQSVVTVTDAAPVVQTDGPTINSTLPSVLYDKPISDFTRSGWALNPAMWAPGSAAGQNGLFLWGGVNGSQTELQVEGGQQSLNLFLNPTSIQEVSIVGGAPPAEYARAVNVNTTFKGGTNQLHAQYLASLKTTAFDAVHSPFFRGARASGIPQWRHNFDVGGPVYIPKVYDGRNKTFFYFNLERPRASTRQGEVEQSIPTQQMMGGDYTSFPTKPLDPTTGQPFPGNVIPADRISANAQAILADVYGQNRYVGDPANFTNNAVIDWHRSAVTRRYVYKFDQNFGTNDVFTFSWQRQRVTSNDSASFFVTDLPSGFGGYFPNVQISESPQNRFSLGHTHIFSPTVINQLRITVLRDINKFYSTDGDGQGPPVLGADVLQRWGLQGITPTGLSGSPGISITNWGTTIYNSSGGTWDTRYQLSENLTWVHGAHSLKGGFSGIKSLYDSLFNPGFGSYSFDGRFTGEPFGDFLLGLPGNFSRSLGRPTIANRISEYGAYMQDDWRVNSQLTLSYGARWDYFTVPYDKNGLYYNFDLATGQIVVPDEKALGNINPLFNTDLIPVVLGSALDYPEKLREPSGRILPRFGFAYRPMNASSLVIRGGYGVYNGALRFAGIQTTGPYTASESFTNSLVNGQPQYAWPNPYPASTGKSPSASTGSSVSKDFRPEWTQSWNLTVEKELWQGWGLRMSYMGNKSTQLPFQYDANTPLISTEPFSQDRRPYPAFQSITRVENGGNDSYNAFQLIFHHPFRNGLFLELGYTEQRGYSDVGGGGPSGFQREAAPGGYLDYAYDRTRDKARSGVWPDHDLLINWAYDLPFGRGKRFGSDWKGQYGAAGSVMNAILGGWSMTGTFNWHSGYFFTPRYSGVDPANINQFSGRADVVPGCDVYTGNKLGDTAPWFNQNCFAIPANGALGNAEINSLVSPGQWVMNLSPFKQFGIPGWERARLEIGANISNLLNHAVYGPPSGIINSDAGARLTNYPFTRRNTEGFGPRNIVFMGRINF